jgi:hypothetical protein
MKLCVQHHMLVSHLTFCESGRHYRARGTVLTCFACGRSRQTTFRYNSLQPTWSTHIAYNRDSILAQTWRISLISKGDRVPKIEKSLRLPQRDASNQQQPVRAAVLEYDRYSLTMTPDKAVANFFTPTSKKEPEKMTWRIIKDSLLVGRYCASSTVESAGQSTKRIAAFDFVSQPGL